MNILIVLLFIWQEVALCSVTCQDARCHNRKGKNVKGLRLKKRWCGLGFSSQDWKTRNYRPDIVVCRLCLNPGTSLLGCRYSAHLVATFGGFHKFVFVLENIRSTSFSRRYLIVCNLEQLWNTVNELDITSDVMDLLRIQDRTQLCIFITPHNYLLCNKKFQLNKCVNLWVKFDLNSSRYLHSF
jgi:hypothetical protein